MKARFVRKALACLIAALCLLGLTPTDARAWGSEGHKIVARIAARHLNRKARAAIQALLKADPSDRSNCSGIRSLEDRLACISTWADQVRNEPEYRHTASQHYVNIPIYVSPNERRYLESRDCPKDCSIRAIEANLRILADGSASDADRATALKFIVHFIGDLNQPMHNVKDRNYDADNRENAGLKIDPTTDLGGNLKIVTWLGQTSYEYGCWNLHSVWDDAIISRKNSDDLSYANRLNRAITARSRAAYQRGTPVDWSDEAYKLAIRYSYGMMGGRDASDKACSVRRENRNECVAYDSGECSGRPVHYRYHLDQSYYARSVPVVEEQLKKAGVRLAKILNDALGK